MDQLKSKTKDLKIAYIGGGSRGWAWKLMSDLAMEPELSGTVKLYDIDQEAATTNEIIGNRLLERDEVVGKWRYEVAKNLEELLVGADFIILSILPGTFREMASDVHLPEKYGIYQSVGDTAGPGGLFRALRTIPIYVEYAAKIKQYAPKAWVINYTNPMALCVKTLYEVFPEIKAFGCCHEVFNTQELLLKMLAMEMGVQGTREEIRTNVLGINHFTWIDQASYQGINLMPLYRRFVEQYYQSGYVDSDTDNWQTDYFKSAQRVKFDLFRRYGLIAAAGDRHLAEFVPWYLKNPEMAATWKFRLTPVEFRIKQREELIVKSKQLAGGTEVFELKHSGEEGIRQLKAIVGLGDLVTNVNLPNRGQIKNLPEKAVVETNSVFSYDSIRPVLAGELPVDIQNLTIRHSLNQELILKAALTHDKELAFRAFINDPLVTLDLAQARELFDAMFESTKDYLLGWH